MTPFNLLEAIVQAGAVDPWTLSTAEVIAVTRPGLRAWLIAAWENEDPVRPSDPMFEFGLSVAKRLWAGPLGLMPDALYSAFYGSALDAWAVADGSDLARGYLALMRMQKILVPISSKK